MPTEHSAAARNNQHGRITLTDGSPTPVSLTLAFTRGDTQVAGLSAELNEAVPIEARGQHVDLVVGPRTYPTLSWSAWLNDLTVDDAPGTMLDFLLRRGAYASNVSASGAGRPYTVNVILDIEGTDLDADADGQVTFPQVRPVVDLAESAEGNNASVQGVVYGLPSGDLSLVQGYQP